MRYGEMYLALLAGNVSHSAHSADESRDATGNVQVVPRTGFKTLYQHNQCRNSDSPSVISTCQPKIREKRR